MNKSEQFYRELDERAQHGTEIPTLNDYTQALAVIHGREMREAYRARVEHQALLAKAEAERKIREVASAASATRLAQEVSRRVEEHRQRERMEAAKAEHERRLAEQRFHEHEEWLRKTEADQKAAQEAAAEQDRLQQWHAHEAELRQTTQPTLASVRVLNVSTIQGSPYDLRPARRRVQSGTGGGWSGTVSWVDDDDDGYQSGTC